MIIDNNPKEIEAMKDRDCRKSLLRNFVKNIKIRTIVHVKKHVVIMETAKNVLQFTEHIRNMYQIV